MNHSIELAERPSDSVAVGHAVEALRSERPIIVFADSVPLLVLAAETARAEQVHFAVRHSSGLLFALLWSARLDTLRIPEQPVYASEYSGLPIGIAVDAKLGVSTGISAIDRAQTLRVLANPSTTVDDLSRPGHVLTWRCRSDVYGNPDAGGYVLGLLEAAGLQPVASACHLVDDSGELLDLEQAEQFADVHSIAMILPAGQQMTRPGAVPAFGR